ncbi:MAG: hypothetical protein ACE5GY_01720 [Thermodesulfobacteriota bacterium]
MSERKSIFFILTGCLFLFIFFLSFCKIYDYDVWFHLKTGEYILRTHAVPGHDIFSHTAYGKPWIAQEWLFGVIIYLVYLAGGVAALTLYKVVLVVSVCAVLYAHLLKRRVHLYIAVPSVLLAAVFISWRLLERPELFGFLFISLYLLTLEDFRLATTGRRSLWLLPAIMVVWVNMQYTALLGLGITGAYLTGSFFALVSGRGGTDRKGPSGFGFLLLITAVTGAAMLLNPNTYHAFTFPLSVIGEISRFAIDEFAPPDWSNHALFFISFAASALIILLNIRRAPVAHLLIFLAFSYMALKHKRNVPLWALAVLPFVAVYLNDLKDRLSETRAGRAGARVLSGPLPAAACVALIVAVSYFTVGGLMRTGWWGAGIRENWLPERSVRFIKDAGIKGNMYNSYELGGYLLWRTYPESRVYIDGRAELYTELRRTERVLKKSDFNYVLDRNGIDFAVVSYSDGNVRYFLTPGVEARMALVFWDDVAMVYVRRTPANAGLIERYGYDFVKPAGTSFRRTALSSMGAYMAEVQRNIRENPKGWRNHMLLANLYGLLGEDEKKEEQRRIAVRNSRL